MLHALKEKPEAWTRVDTILETSTKSEAKFFALSILDDAIQCRWKSMPPEQKDGIRSYIVGKVIAVRQLVW